MSDPQIIRIQSTSATTADVTPILLRRGERTRLVFIPILVDNDENQAASVRGIFVYQRKQQNKPWEDCSAINLSSLRAGEGVRLELKSSELLDLYKCLGALYRNYEEIGIESGDKRCILVDIQSSAHKVLDALQSTPNAPSVLAVIEWINSQDPSLITEYFGSRTETLLKLDNTLGIARLQSFITKTESLLESPSEYDWQKFFKQESWAIGQIYAEPVVVIQDQPYVGGKGVDNRGGSVADFLYRNALSDNCMVIEIKNPTAPLVADDPNDEEPRTERFPRAYRRHPITTSISLHAGAKLQVTSWRRSPKVSYIQPPPFAHHWHF